MSWSKYFDNFVQYFQRLSLVFPDVLALTISPINIEKYLIQRLPFFQNIFYFNDLQIILLLIAEQVSTDLPAMLSPHSINHLLNKRTIVHTQLDLEITYLLAMEIYPILNILFYLRIYIILIFVHIIGMEIISIYFIHTDRTFSHQSIIYILHLVILIILIQIIQIAITIASRLLMIMHTPQPEHKRSPTKFVRI